jgi:type IV pilus assembly protein PilY1
MNPDCTTTFTGSLTDVTSTPNADPAAITNGWRIDLDASGDYTYPEGNPSVNVTRNYRAERVITDPLSTSSGLVFFTSYKPYNDVCAYGGKSFIWAVRYSTGGAPGALLKGIALLQVSTGSIEQVNLSTAFTLAGGRKSSALEGVPPLQQGLSLLSTPPPIKRTIHIRER